MKKSALPAGLLLLGLCLSGCPIYDNGSGDGCFDDYDCRYGYVCDTNSGACLAQTGSSSSCQAPSDCLDNETCSRFGTCVTGDCHFASVGCVRGYECSSASGAWQCVAPSAGAGGAGGAGGDDAGGANTGAVSTAGGEPSRASGGASDTAGAGG